MESVRAPHDRVPSHPDARRSSSRARRAGYTLVEILVSISIVVLLLAVLLPALGHTARAARSFRCQMTLRAVAFDFSVFADERLHGPRGDDESLGRGRFRVETFQESLYAIDEFWAFGDEPVHRLPDADRFDPLRCAEVRGPIELRRAVPCSQGAVGPPENISYGFNMRLHRAEVVTNGRPRLMPVRLSPDVIGESGVPLAWDVDGLSAQSKGVTPVFSAPSLDSRGPFAGDQFWFPSSRHNGAGAFAFLGGHVLTSRRPLEEAGWAWGFQTVR